MERRHHALLFLLYTFVKYLCVVRIVSNVTCPRVADIVLALDQSTSIIAGDRHHSSGYVQILRFAKSVAGGFPISSRLTQVGLLKFNSSTEIVFHLDRYGDRRSLLGAIDGVDMYGGETNVAAALRVTRRTMFSRSHGARRGVPKILIMLTDGVGNRESHRTVEEARLTKAENISILVVGVTHLVDPDQLREIASRRDHCFFAATFAELDSILPRLLHNSCNEAATLPTTSTTSTTTTTTNGTQQSFASRLY